ncbi:MAG: hypothetical protein AB9846_12350 [Tenuifilaceae bacterium]
MNKIIASIGILVFVGITSNVIAQNTNKYSGKVDYKGNEYFYETSCAGIKPMTTTTIETFGLTIYQVKKDKKKLVLKTHCTALEVRRNDSSVKENLDKIYFSTVINDRLSPEVEGTSKKLTLEFHLDNFTLIPLYNRDARRGCASFDEGIKNVVFFILKEIK